MDTPSQDEIDRRLKELEREKREEELRQLKADARFRWVTPAALAALLPLVAGLGLWVWGEVKQYNEGYRALEEKKTLVADMRKAIETPGPVVVDVRVTREENTYPMIAPGAAARDMVG